MQGMWILKEMFANSDSYEISNPQNQPKDILLKRYSYRTDPNAFIVRYLKDRNDASKWRAHIKQEENKDICVALEETVSGIYYENRPPDCSFGLRVIKCGQTIVTLEHFLGDRVLETQKVTVTIVED